ncbi:MAG TPA: valine--tRNA ligase [Anaerolineaceae bacterium]|nr:valine--tRNA ligase [Anaerolineaceae bacterium]
MSKFELPKAYDFQATEKRIYKFWESAGYFQPSNDPNKPDFDPTKKPFVISIPPPNVTGKLHLGHAMFISMEDLMIRHARMKGIPTLWVPGTDHAGIATQLQVEKELAGEGITRDDIGREAFVKRTWEWKEEYGGHITQQIRRLGASCDWTRERFTLDEGLSVAVREAFVRLYEKGLIYRGPRLINWSPNLRTAVSDLEVEYSQEQGTLYYFKYMLADDSGDFIPVATTRPETILGDSAVAVHPEDDRYQKYIGKMALVPMLGREIPVIADTYVDREFGTGALKITPAHDPHDYEIGMNHNLESINILNKDATINENGGPYQSLDRFVCRKQLWSDMKEAGLVIKEEPYALNVPRSQRGGEIIEPMISTQWFVKIQPLAQAALEAVQNGQIRIIPDHFTKVYYNWLENIQDWCISRQLWWGHRIPVWYCDDCHALTVAREDPTQCSQCNSMHIHQDEDVLDTWFSSGLWPFSTLGWPEETPDYNYFYPTTVLETGYDILFFWVARMIMDGIEFTGKPPFETVYLHGLVRDGNGQKMSKTKGNVIDPLTVMDTLGTDALRFTLLVGSTPGKDTNLSIDKVEANRNFANKIWNAGRFVISALEKTPAKPIGEPRWTSADEFIHARMRSVVRDVNYLFENYQYGEAGRQIYDFFWSEFADWYIELAKLQLNEGGDQAYYTALTLVRVLDKCLRLLHPFTPFVTEELWQALKKAVQDSGVDISVEGGWAEALIVARWSESMKEEEWEKPAIQSFQTGMIEVVKAIRNTRLENKLPFQDAVEVSIVTNTLQAYLEKELPFITALCNLSKVNILAELPHGEKYRQYPSASLPLSGSTLFIHTSNEGLLAEKRHQLESELSSIQAQINRLETLLESDFAKKAPENVVQKERDRLEAYQDTADKLKNQLKTL